MLVQARREGESLLIGGIIQVKVLSVTGKIVRLGIDAPKEITVTREVPPSAKTTPEKE